MMFPERTFIAVFLMMQIFAWGCSEHTLLSMMQCEAIAIAPAALVWLLMRSLKLMFYGFRW